MQPDVILEKRSNITIAVEGLEETLENQRESMSSATHFYATTLMETIIVMKDAIFSDPDNLDPKILKNLLDYLKEMEGILRIKSWISESHTPRGIGLEPLG